MTGSESVRVLVADDEASLIEDYQYALAQPVAGAADLRLAELHEELFGPLHKRSGLPSIDLVAVRQGREAVQQVRKALEENRPFSLAFLDVRMPPGTNGVDTAAQIREIDQNLQIVIVTAYSDIQTVDLVQRVPPAHRLFLLQKPFHAIEIQQLAIALTAKWEAERFGADHSSFTAAGDWPASLEHALCSLPGGIAVFDHDSRITRTNEAIEHLFPELRDLLKVGTRYAALQAGLASRLLPDEVLLRKDRAASRHAWIAGNGRPVERRLADNRWIMITEHDLSSGGSVVQFLDITALKEAERRHAIASAMIQMSRFAGAIVDRFKESTVDPVPADANVDDSNLAATAHDLLNELIPLAQSQRLAPAVVLPDALLADVAKETRAQVRSAIEIEVVTTVGLWPIFADNARAREALRSLVDNAVDAMAGTGRITLETGNLRISREVAADYPTLKAGDYVRIAVKDSGAGMSAELIERAVMPFFTSKDPTRHRGLGLSNAYCFVAQSGGCLVIDSDGRSGTTVSLYFPRAPASVVATEAPAAPH